MLTLFVATAAVMGMLLGGPTAGKPAGGRTSPAVTTEAACPLIYEPVICDNGKVYPNRCVAEKHHAKNCVPYGDGI